MLLASGLPGHNMIGHGLILFLLIGLVCGKVCRSRDGCGGGYVMIGALIVSVVGALLGGWLFGCWAFQPKA